jgi:dihydrofolate reductase
VFIALSADGFIARSDGGLDWLSRVERGGEDYGYKAFAETTDVLVMGRNTYDVVLGIGHWGYEGMRCIILTNRPAESRRGEEFFSGSPEQLADQLARQGARRVYVDGGVVIRQFLAARLIDDLTLSVIPVLLGSGIPLFATGASEQALVLETSQSFDSGLVQLRYRVQHEAR